MPFWRLNLESNMPGDILLFSGNFELPLDNGEDNEFFPLTEEIADKEGDADAEGEFSDGEEIAEAAGAGAAADGEL